MLVEIYQLFFFRCSSWFSVPKGFKYKVNEVMTGNGHFVVSEIVNQLARHTGLNTCTATDMQPLKQMHVDHW